MGSPSPHSPRMSIQVGGTNESDRSFSNSPEMASTPIPNRGDTSSPEPSGNQGNADILRELLDRKRSLLALSLQVINLSIILFLDYFHNGLNLRQVEMEDPVALQRPEAL